MGKKQNGWKWLTESIPAGEAEAVSMQHLARVLDIGERELRREVENARRAGILICSSKNGYFMPETIHELKAYARRAEKRAKTNKACLRPFLRWIRKAEAGRV